MLGPAILSQLYTTNKNLFAKYCQGFSERVVQTSGIVQNKPYFKPYFQQMSHSFPLYTVEASNNYR